MNRPQIQIELRDRDIGALVPRSTLSVAIVILGTVAALFFALGLAR